MLMAEPPSMDANEIADKGYVNQAATRSRRAHLVDELFGAAARPAHRHHALTRNEYITTETKTPCASSSPRPSWPSPHSPAAPTLPRRRSGRRGPSPSSSPAPPAGATDVLARVLADELGKSLKTTVIVDNKPGASGMLGAVARGTRAA